ncbi:MAG TPA: hypothetical protein VGL39_27600 [Jatrophihabitantaceae bacterium]|jgi:hypothetical protein
MADASITIKFEDIRDKVAALIDAEMRAVIDERNTLRASVDAVTALLDQQDLISPNAIVETRYVRMAVDTGQVPFILKRRQ